MKEKHIMPIWQPLGASTHIIAKKVCEKFGVLTSHTGTLDPMAEGVVIVLLGEARHKKYEYAAWKKTYEFEVVFGIETDTYDGLGLVKGTSDGEISQKKLSEVSRGMEGDYAQTIPTYSAIKMRGKPLHWYARNSKLDEISLPKRSGQIFALEVLDLYEISCTEMISSIKAKIEKVKGDLRQDEIVEGWERFLERNALNKYKVAKLQVEMTKGLYVRSLCVDIANKLDSCGFVYSLVRKENGEYSKETSKTIDELFGVD